MKRKRGYGFFLALTKVLTLLAVFVIVSGLISSMPLGGRSLNFKLVCAVMLLFLAGSSCVVRKRVFTEPQSRRRGGNVKRALEFVVLFCCIAYAGGFEKILTGGLALTVGDRAPDMKAGFNVGLSGMTKPVRFFGVGGHLGYNRWSLPRPSSLIRADKGSLHYIETSVIARGLGPIDRNIRFFGELSPGFYVDVARSYSAPEHRSDVGAHFGFSFSAGLDVRRFEVAPKYKVILTGDRRTRWIALTAGFIAR